ncbi:hypothetical protein SASPL_132909 [Salvia splendens]|uniref:Shikimate O-hydroxycinnamoyltransferase n=1 Tax=Salvia splendens TaxID=180675 RepID=A0A8X8X3X1_SALSN|nr:vinorine synthase-like [Salvia splendens]KAG6405320.1 hypothetical protein SASPL_132909 [Salvia splendens]
METETKLISIETITPSYPTPKSLQKHQLSYLDQTMLPSFIHLVYFYSPNPKISNSEKSKQLKKSLSEALSIYYPLAGRLVGNLYVDCNDAGIPFSEAEADIDLSQVTTNQNHTYLKKFLPLTTDDLCLAIQATFFRCGGLAVGISFAHKIGDGLSFVLFVNTWSAVARDGSGGGVALPKFDTATYAPPLDVLNELQQPAAEGLKEEEVAGRILTFSATEIAALQERYAGSNGRRPTRVEALSAFIWSVYTEIKSEPGWVGLVYKMANLRSRAEPPLSEYQFGNVIVTLRVDVAAGNSGGELTWKLRDALKEIDGGYLGRLKKREVQMEELTAHTQDSQRAMERFFFSSWCRFPFYEADFGWGGPERVINGGSPVKNVAYFMDTKSGGGIEILLQLTKSNMDKLEARLML